jgi:error-prone DNA polymerase
MAAWKRKGGLQHYYDKIVNGMTRNGYDRVFAEQIFAQIQGFGEYGFPESHAAGFALIAYQSAWLKCHEPEAFLAALLNSQPMGFYSPSTLVQDARRHGVAVRPVDVTCSDWEAAFEDLDAPRPAVRLGMNLIKGMDEAAARRIADARAQQPFSDTGDLALRAELNRSQLQALGAANALFRLAGHRRQALWQAVVSAPDRGLLRSAAIQETEQPQLVAPTEGEDLVSDYRSLALTLGRHPLALLRDRLSSMRFASAEQLRDYPTGRVARACGIVTIRQRPGTSKGTIFVTLEDETGTVNVIVWPRVVEQQRQALLGSQLMGVYGTWQNENQVRHLVAGRLVNLSPMLGELATRSRNFH